jgi:hypothetical protein
MSDTERLIRIRYYLERLHGLFAYQTIGDAGYQAARLIETMRELTYQVRTDDEKTWFEHLCKSGRFSESDSAVKETI